MQEDDIFTWKIERIRKNDPKGGYVVGVAATKDIFTAGTVEGTRERKPNSAYANFLRM